MRTYLIEPQQAKLDIPYADHDYDYLYIIKTVNNAKLQTTYTFQVNIFFMSVFFNQFILYDPCKCK